MTDTKEKLEKVVKFLNKDYAIHNQATLKYGNGFVRIDIEDRIISVFVTRKNDAQLCFNVATNEYAKDTKIFVAKYFDNDFNEYDVNEFILDAHQFICEQL